VPRSSSRRGSARRPPARRRDEVEAHGEKLVFRQRRGIAGAPVVRRRLRQDRLDFA
jgi:hypothetical protein